MLTRAISAFLGVLGLFLVWNYFETNGLIVTCCIVTLVACIEFSAMVEKESNTSRALFTGLSYSFFLIFSFVNQSFVTFISLFILLAAYFTLCVEDEVENRVRRLTSWTMGALYCGGFTGVVMLGIRHFGGRFFVGLLLLSFLTDTFAYLGGRLLGRTPLAPKISPKKTLEGSVVGLIGGSLSGFLFLKTLPHTSPQWVLILTCLAGSLFSQVGDLFESSIKRYSGVKDSGKILPGHGGALDRIDGVLFASPVLFLWMQAFAS